MTILFIAFTSFFVALSGALVPGPLFTITVAESARWGFRTGPLIILGHAILELVLILSVVLGLAPFFSKPTVIFVISIFGGLMLIFMGLKMIRDARTVRLSLKTHEKPRSMHPVLSGIVGSISNPYWSLWWASVGLGYLVSSFKLGVFGIIVFFIGHISADLGWYSLVSYTVSKGKEFIGDKGYRSLFYTCGIFLILFGLWFMSGL